MLRFEEIGVEKQYASTSLREAKYHYEQSCNRCGFRVGTPIDCKHCHIEGAHAIVVEYFVKYHKSI